MWYKRASEYDAYRVRIEELGRENPRPFRAWFNGQDRIYLDLSTSDPLTADKEVSDALAAQGYKVVDYSKGHCTSDGRRIISIGKVLNSLHQKELQKLDTQKETVDDFELSVEKNKVNQKYEELKKIYESSSLRSANSANYKVVISQNPHDVAMMSTDRSWSSCMTLGSGEQHQNVYCEVQSGGIIAYLIRENDVEIKKPLSRLLIRHFQNDRGRSVAVPEQTVYGVDSPLFVKTVKNWISQKQKIPTGVFKMQGGRYSDDLQPDLYSAPEKESELREWLNFEDKPKFDITYLVTDYLASTFNEILGSLYDIGGYVADEKEKDYVFTSAENCKTFIRKNENDSSARLELHDLTKQLEDEVKARDAYDDYAEEIKRGYYYSKINAKNNRYAAKRFRIAKSRFDMSGRKRVAAMDKVLNNPKKKYSERLIREIKDFLFTKGRSRVSTYREQLAKKYPHLLTKKDYEMLSKYLQRPEELDESQKEILRDIKLREMLSKLTDVNSFLDGLFPRESRSGRIGTGESIYHNIYTLMSNLESQFYEACRSYFSPIPTPLATKLIELIDTALAHLNTYYQDQVKENKLDEKLLGTLKGKIEETQRQFMRDLIGVFQSTNTDTPVVQNYYKKVIQHINLFTDEKQRDELGRQVIYAIAGLGSNAIQFLPFLRIKLTEQQEKYKTLLKEWNNAAVDYNPGILIYGREKVEAALQDVQILRSTIAKLEQLGNKST